MFPASIPMNAGLKSAAWTNRHTADLLFYRLYSPATFAYREAVP